MNIMIKFFILISMVSAYLFISSVSAEEINNRSGLLEKKQQISKNVYQLIDAVSQNSDVTVDEMTCAEVMMDSFLQRKEILGLLDNKSVVEEIGQHILDYRQAVYNYFQQLQLQNYSVAIKNISLLSETINTKAVQENIESSSGFNTVYDSGIVTLELKEKGESVVFPVYLLDDHWCVNPVNIS